MQPAMDCSEAKEPRLPQGLGSSIRPCWHDCATTSSKRAIRARDCGQGQRARAGLSGWSSWPCGLSSRACGSSFRACGLSFRVRTSNSPDAAGNRRRRSSLKIADLPIVRAGPHWDGRGASLAAAVFHGEGPRRGPRGSPTEKSHGKARSASIRDTVSQSRTPRRRSPWDADKSPRRRSGEV